MRGQGTEKTPARDQEGSPHQDVTPGTLTPHSPRAVRNQPLRSVTTGRGISLEQPEGTGTLSGRMVRTQTARVQTGDTHLRGRLWNRRVRQRLHSSVSWSSVRT